MVVFIGSYTDIFVGINILSLVTPQVAYYSRHSGGYELSKKGKQSLQFLPKRENNTMVIYKILWLCISSE